MINLKHICEDLTRKFPQITSIYLGGSFAINIDNDFSDIDLFPFFNEITKELIEQVRLFKQELEEKYNRSFDITPSHLDFLTQQVPVSHGNFSLKRVLYFSSIKLWGNDLSEYIKPVDNLRLHVLHSTYYYLASFLFFEKDRSGLSLNYTFLKSGLKYYIGTLILNNKELLSNSFHYFYQGLDNPKYGEWKKYSNEINNKVHETFYQKKKLNFNKNYLYLHHDLIKEFLSFHKDHVRLTAYALIKELEKIEKTSRPIKISSNILNSYKEAKHYNINPKEVYDIKLFLIRIKSALHSYLSILNE